MELREESNSVTDETSPVWRVEGIVAPPQVSFFYKAGLAGIAVAMVMLPLAYLCLIGAVAFAIYYHAVNPRFGIANMRGTAGLLAYFGPIIVGTVLVFFMVKPLFARRAKSNEPVPITRQEEPELFRFIETICGLLRSPQPRRVLINLDVNASASFCRGLLSLFGRDLNLSIGLPLIAGLTVRQFGGVLAHEFGHFAQGAGMRLTFIVRSVNAWFARVVYERDAWDERLAKTAHRADFRLGIILHLARLAVWVTRRILWLLMMVGHGISCFMLRQMEFDADYFETQVAGSDTFCTTTRRLRFLNVGWQQTIAHQNEALSTKRLTVDLPGLVAQQANRMSPEVQRMIEASLSTSTTGWFDTHPSDKDRLRASKTIASDGILRGEGPATVLFRDFPAVARTRTAAYYRDDCGIELKDISLSSIEEMSSEAKANAVQQQCFDAWFGNVLTDRTMIAITPDDLTAAVRANGDIVDEPYSRDHHRLLLSNAMPALEALAKANAAELLARHALVLLDAGFQVKKKDFGLKEGTRKAAEAAIAAAESHVSEQMAKLRNTQEAIRRHLIVALRQNVRDSAEIRRLVNVLSRIGEHHREVLEIRNAVTALELLLHHVSNATNANLWNVTARRLATAISENASSILESFKEYETPFRTLAELCCWRSS